MSSPRDTPFSKPNSKSIYGKTPLESWVGTVVSYDSQKQQIEGGWGWRYKVRIMGDNTNTDQITDEQLGYAYVLLPTTAGSGGAYKMRSVRISQGDFVYGIRGGGAGAPTMILGVFPRTAGQESGSGNFSNVSGFTGELQKTKILDGEFNEQTGPQTPGTNPVGPKNYNKALAKNPAPAVEQLGFNKDGPEVIDNVLEVITPPTTDGDVVWEPPNVGDTQNVGDIPLTGNESDSEIAKKVGDTYTFEDGTVGIITKVGIVTAGGTTDFTSTADDIQVEVDGEQSETNNQNGFFRNLFRPKPNPIASSQLKKLLTNTSKDDIVAVVDGISPARHDRDIDPNTGLYKGVGYNQSGHEYQGGIAEYWKKIESQRELTEREKRYKKRGQDQHGSSLEYHMREVIIVDSVAYYRVKQQNGTYMFESPKPELAYWNEYKSYVNKAIDQGITQNIVDPTVANDAKRLVWAGDFEGALDLIFPRGIPETLS